MLNQSNINKKIETNRLYYIAFNFVLPVILCAIFFIEIIISFDNVTFFFVVVAKIYCANKFVFDLLKENYEIERELIQRRTKKNNVYPATNHSLFSAFAMVAVMSPFAIYIMLLENATQKD